MELSGSLCSHVSALVEVTASGPGLVKISFMERQAG